jgi:chromosome condensin MukBEF ATPase and DNA-binding subunit MukB
MTELEAGGCARDQRTTQYCREAVDAFARAEKAEAEVERLRTQLADLEQALSITKAELRLAREARSDEWKRAEDAEARVAKLEGARCRFDETWKCHD